MNPYKKKTNFVKLYKITPQSSDLALEIGNINNISVHSSEGQNRQYFN